MPVLFEGNPGRVKQLVDPTLQGVIPPLIEVQTDKISFQAHKTIVTHLTLGLGTNHQFLHTLGGDLYIYVFGDRIGQLGISGLCVADDCDRLGDQEHGIEKMIKWFNKNKLSTKPDPITCMVGRTPIKGFLSGINFGTFDHKLRLVQFNVDIHIIPEKAR
jgi:hypothetical protein